jgi:hypothetical protein
MLSDFFRINMPYGFKINSKGECFVFNREYVPLGWNSDSLKSDFADDKPTLLPIYTKYKGLSEDEILKIIKNPKAIQRNEEGRIHTVFFYEDKTNPQTNPECWSDYFEIIKAFSKFEIVR